jgi:hypothetical protein
MQQPRDKRTPTEELYLLCGPCRDLITGTVLGNQLGVEYLHRDPASRRRRQKGSLKFETVKYGTRARERLRWRGPAAYVYKRQTRPLVRDGGPTKTGSNCQRVINIWSWAPDKARHQDLLIDWPSIIMWLLNCNQLAARMLSLKSGYKEKTIYVLTSVARKRLAETIIDWGHWPVCVSDLWSVVTRLV